MLESARDLHLVIPAGMEVHVTIGNPPPGIPGLRGAEPVPARSGRPLLIGAFAVALLSGGYLAGHLDRRPAGDGIQASLAAPPRPALPGPAPDDAAARPARVQPPLVQPRAFGDSSVPRDPAAAASPPGQVPPQFADQLRQPPTVIPPPGQPPPGPRGKNAFGLED